ncbi:hypothetical protein EBS02_06265, partial [bacterium]|nr:hypothetical protein [bacterium]
PQYVTNLSSFEDSVQILKNKGILTEADTNSSEGKWKTVTGKDLYVQNDGPDLIVNTFTNSIISVSSTTWNWYFNDEETEISGANSNIYRPLQTGYYKAKVSYQTSLGLHIVQSSPYYIEVSDRPTY